MIALGFVCAGGGIAQGPVSIHTVQAVVDGLRTYGQAQQLDVFLRDQVGVRVARTDYNTRNLMLQIEPASALNEEQLRSWVHAFGFELRCYRRGPVNSFAPMDPRNCVSGPQDH